MLLFYPVPMDQPSETAQGAAWIANFPEVEKPLARLLLNSLHVSYDSNLRADLSGLLAQVVGKVKQPTAIFPVRELEEFPEEAEEIEDGSPSVSITGPPKFQPLDFPYKSLPGSEGMAGNIIRDIIGNSIDESKASSPKTIDEVRRIKARTVILVDDYAGTGNRITGYLSSWLADRTVRSWFSGGLIRFHVVVYAASGRAIKSFAKNKRIEKIHYVHKAPDFSSASWTDQEVREIREMCMRYSASKALSLGYKNAEGLFLMQHTVPNNMPMILWQNGCRKVKDWQPLFRDRRMDPSMQNDWGNYFTDRRLADIDRTLRQLTLAGGAIDYRSVPRLALVLLKAAAEGHRDATRAAPLLGMSTEWTASLGGVCRRVGLLDAAGRLTDAGHAVLTSDPKASQSTVPALRLIGSTTPYYPLSLRGARDI